MPRQRMAQMSWATSNIIIALVFACFLSLVDGQQRSTTQSWEDQLVKGGEFNVHSFDVFSGANSLSITVDAKRMSGLPLLGVWLRHGAIPTQEQHKVHTLIHSSSEEHKVGLHVENPLQGTWFLVISAASAGGEAARTSSRRGRGGGGEGIDDGEGGGNGAPSGGIESTGHRFIKIAGEASYDVDMHTGGCARGRFGFPACGDNWMRLSWGAQAAFHGVLHKGGDRWTCSMYEVAPYTSRLTLSLVEKAAAHGRLAHQTPQIYARYHAYPSASEYDATTAVGGTTWSPSTEISLPKSGTWYVCVHAHSLASPELPVSVQVDAQVLPHTECVERNLVAKDGSKVRHVTQCEDEVQKLAMVYKDEQGGGLRHAMPLPHFVATSSKGGGMLHVSGESLRYFAFTLDSSTSGLTLHIKIKSPNTFGTALVYLRQDALPQTHSYDLRRQMSAGHLDWNIRYPSAGDWYMGIFADSGLDFELELSVVACPGGCSGNGMCLVSDQGKGIVVAQCSCQWGYTGDACQNRSPDLPASSYYATLLIALASTFVALPPALYALYKDRYAEAFAFSSASATSLAFEGSQLLTSKGTGLFGTGSSSLASSDAALTLTAVTVALISAGGLPSNVSSCLILMSASIFLLLCSSFPSLILSPAISLAPALAALPIITARRIGLGTSRVAAQKPLGSLKVQWLAAGIILSIVALLCCIAIRNDNFVIMHAMWRTAMFACGACFSLSCSSTLGGEEARQGASKKDGDGGDERTPLVQDNNMMI